MASPIVPLTSPQFLTDALFVQYGFFTGTSTAFQRQAAYTIAEWQVAQQVGTFLTPTQITGTYPWVRPDIIIECDVTRLVSVDAVVLHERYTNNVERLLSGTAFVIDYMDGYFMARQSPFDASSCMGCYGVPQGVYKATVTYTAGLPTGTLAQPNIMLALCMAADIVSKFMYDEGALPSGDDFIKTFQSGRYLQTVSDKYQYETVFGRSNKAQYIRKLLAPYIHNPVKRLRRSP